MTLPIEPPDDGGGGSTFTNQVSGLIVIKKTAASTTVSFDISGSLSAVYGARIRRSFTNNISSATVIAYPTKQSHVSFDDTDPTIVGRTVYYWADISSTVTPSFYQNGQGPVSISMEPPEPVQPFVFFDASHDAEIDGTISINVIVALVFGARFSSCRIYISGYRGVAGDKLIAQSPDNAFSFALQATSEDVTLKAVMVNGDGEQQDIATALTKQINLGPGATVPEKMANFLVTEFKNGVQLIFGKPADKDLTSYRLYRSARGDAFGDAVLISELKATGEQYVVLFDPNGKSGSYQWYVSAVNSVGEGLPSEPVFDPTSY